MIERESSFFILNISNISLTMVRGMEHDINQSLSTLDRLPVLRTTSKPIHIYNYINCHTGKH